MTGLRAASSRQQLLAVLHVGVVRLVVAEVSPDRPQRAERFDGPPAILTRCCAASPGAAWQDAEPATTESVVVMVF